jgi:hypothetical protein
MLDNLLPSSSSVYGYTCVVLALHLHTSSLASTYMKLPIARRIRTLRALWALFNYCPSIRRRHVGSCVCEPRFGLASFNWALLQEACMRGAVIQFVGSGRHQDSWFHDAAMHNMTHSRLFHGENIDAPRWHPDPEAMHRLPPVATKGVPCGKDMLPVHVPLMSVTQWGRDSCHGLRWQPWLASQRPVPQFHSSREEYRWEVRWEYKWTSCRLVPRQPTWLIQYYFIA